jgi:hypothetical protein
MNVRETFTGSVSSWPFACDTISGPGHQAIAYDCTMVMKVLQGTVT